MLRRTAKPSPASTPTQSMNAASLMHEPKSVADVAFPPQLPFRVHPRKWSTGISRHRLGRVGLRPSSHPGSWGRPTGWSRCPTAASRPTRCRYHKLSARCGGAGQGAEALQLGRAGRRTKQSEHQMQLEKRGEWRGPICVLGPRSGGPCPSPLWTLSCLPGLWSANVGERVSIQL